VITFRTVYAAEPGEEERSTVRCRMIDGTVVPVEDS
jgi:hypothetical protein